VRGPESSAPLYTVVLTFDTAELRAATREVIAWGAALSLAFLLFTSFAIVFVAHRLITRRVQHTLRALKQIEDGALETRIPITAADELGDLQQGINSMTEKLAATIAEQKQAQARIRQLAFYDQLTGLPNRVAILEYLREVLSNDGGSHGALLLFDLDDFKTLNETLGHEAGDELLREVAERLRDGLGGEAQVARAGGDEFLVVLTGLDEDEAEARDRIEALFERLRTLLVQPCRIGPRADAHHRQLRRPPCFTGRRSGSTSSSSAPNWRCTTQRPAAVTACVSSMKRWRAPCVTAPSSSGRRRADARCQHPAG